MLHHQNLDDATLRRLIRSGALLWAGNIRLGIYGRLGCAQGRRMKRANRVFFAAEAAARAAGFRPCGHCMPEAYRAWKAEAPGATTGPAHR